MDFIGCWHFFIVSVMNDRRNELIHWFATFFVICCNHKIKIMHFQHKCWYVIGGFIPLYFSDLTVSIRTSYLKTGGWNYWADPHKAWWLCSRWLCGKLMSNKRITSTVISHTVTCRLKRNISWFVFLWFSLLQQIAGECGKRTWNSCKVCWGRWRAQWPATIWCWSLCRCNLLIVPTL